MGYGTFVFRLGYWSLNHSKEWAEPICGPVGEELNERAGYYRKTGKQAKSFHHIVKYTDSNLNVNLTRNVTPHHTNNSLLLAHCNQSRHVIVYKLVTIDTTLLIHC